MNRITEILNKYTSGEETLDATNAALKDAGAEFHLDPSKNTISDEEIRMYGLLDSGTGTLDKVRVENGKIVDDIGDMKGILFYDGQTFNVN